MSQEPNISSLKQTIGPEIYYNIPNEAIKGLQSPSSMAIWKDLVSNNIDFTIVDKILY